MYLMATIFVRVSGGKERVSGSEMDAQRAQQMAYEYLCHLEEARV